MHVRRIEGTRRLKPVKRWGWLAVAWMALAAGSAWAQAAALVPVLLREAAQLRVITTSREPLAVAGEVLRPVLPLSVPDTESGIAD